MIKQTAALNDATKGSVEGIEGQTSGSGPVADHTKTGTSAMEIYYPDHNRILDDHEGKWVLGILNKIRETADAVPFLNKDTVLAYELLYSGDVLERFHQEWERVDLDTIVENLEDYRGETINDLTNYFGVIVHNTIKVFGQDHPLRAMAQRMKSNFELQVYAGLHKQEQPKKIIQKKEAVVSGSAKQKPEVKKAAPKRPSSSSASKPPAKRPATDAKVTATPKKNNDAKDVEDPAKKES